MDFTIHKERNSKIVFTDEQKKYIYDSYVNKKHTIRQICRELNISRHVITRCLRQQGVDTSLGVSHYTWTQEQIDDIIDRYCRRKQSLTKIGDDYNVSFTTIRRLLVENKISIQTPNRLEWSQEDVEFIVEEYSNRRYSLVALAEKFKVDVKSIKTVLRDHNVPLYYNAGLATSRLMVSTKNYFESIETPEQAYWMGYLLADVGLYTGNHLKITSKDLDVVEKFQQALCAHTYTIESKQKGKNKEYNLVIKNAQITRDLISYGFAVGGIRSKIDNSFALDLIPEEFWYDIVRGCFDKCGSIYFSDKKCSIQWTGSKNTLTVIREIVGKNEVSLVRSASDEYLYGLQISGQESVKKILLNMYENSMPETRSERKFKIVQDVLSSLGANTFEPVDRV